jgi:hypothetical protein
MTENKGITKNDLYACLIKEGVKRGYEVIPEFVVKLSNSKTRKIDLVWASRKAGREWPQNDLNPKYWNLRAGFEIEGCNIRKLPNEFKRHKKTFRFISRTYSSKTKIDQFVVLYTAAFDRKNFHKKLDRNSEVAARLKWSDDHVVVVDFEGIEAKIETIEHAAVTKRRKVERRSRGSATVVVKKDRP